MSQEQESKQSDGKRRAEEVDLDEEKAAKKPRLPDASPEPLLDTFSEEILNGDREASHALKVSSCAAISSLLFESCSLTPCSLIAVMH